MFILVECTPFGKMSTYYIELQQYIRYIRDCSSFFFPPYCCSKSLKSQHLAFRTKEKSSSLGHEKQESLSLKKKKKKKERALQAGKAFC